MTSHSSSSFLEPLYTLAKYSGLLPLNEDLQLSEKWWKISFLPITLISIQVFGIRLFLWVVSEQDQNNYFYNFIECTNQTLAIAIIYSHCFSIYRLKDKLIKFGRTVAMLSEGYAYKLYVPTLYTPLGLLTNLLLFIINSDKKNGKIIFFLEAALFLIESLNYLNIMSFCAFLEMLHQHFKGIVHGIQSKSLELTTKKSLILISACEDLCEIHGLPLLFTFIRCLIDIVVMGHSIAVDLNYFDYFPIDKSLKRLFHKLSVILIILYSLLMITGSCRKIQTSLNRFNELIFREFRRRPNLVKNNAVKLYITKNPSVHFSACGFFSIENSLVTSILATAITYVVIFVQFNMPDPEV